MSDKSFVLSKVIKDCIYAQFYVLHIWRHFKSCSYSSLVHPTSHLVEAMYAKVILLL